MLEPADPLDRAGRGAGGLGVARRRVGEEGGEDRQRRLLPALEAAACGGDRAGVIEVTAIEGRAEAAEPVLVGAEAGDLEADARVLRVDQRPGGEQQVDPLGDDQLADEDDPAFARGSSSGWNSSTSTPGGPRRVLSFRFGRSGSAAQREAPVWAEPTRTPFAAAIPS